MTIRRFKTAEGIRIQKDSSTRFIDISCSESIYVINDDVLAMDYAEDSSSKDEYVKLNIQLNFIEANPHIFKEQTS